MFDYQEECRVLIRILSTGDFTEARMRTAILLEKISQLHSVSTDYIKHILFYLYDQLYAYSKSRHMGSAKQMNAAAFPALSQPVPEFILQELDHFEYACTQINALLELIIRQQCLLEEGPDPANELIRKAQAYIRTHYKDENLSLTAIAEYLHINPSYLSRMFSQALSMSVSDYIAHLRIQHAKTLLRAAVPLTVEQVASASGFFTVQTFIRTFRKYEQMTPGAYQKKKARQEGEPCLK